MHPRGQEIRGLRIPNTIINEHALRRYVADYKIVHDPVHGSIRFEGVFLALLETPELQRLNSIHQLGLAYLVYPGANHTRLEHSLGTFAVARRMCSALRLPEEEAKTVQCAALLHDVGHLPFSHTLEFVLHSQFGIDHEAVSRSLIRGDETVLTEREAAVVGTARSLPETLERFGVDAEQVASLLEGQEKRDGPQKTLSQGPGQSHFNSRRYMSQLVSGPVDADQLDYLKRDAHYTGVAYGVVDLDRLVETIRIFNGDLVVDRGGLSALEGMLVARALMFSAVYFHKTVRIAELMLAKAVEGLGRDWMGTLHTMTDAGLLSHLLSEGGYYEEIATLIKYRRLFKKAYGLRTADVHPDDWRSIDVLGRVRNRRALEADIAHRAGIDPGHVIVDVPSSELAISEPRIALTDVRILDGSRVRLLPRISSIAASLQIRRAHEWALLVACPAQHKERVARAASKVLGSTLSSPRRA